MALLTFNSTKKMCFITFVYFVVKTVICSLEIFTKQNKATNIFFPVNLLLFIVVFFFKCNLINQNIKNKLFLLNNIEILNKSKSCFKF